MMSWFKNMYLPAWTLELAVAIFILVGLLAAIFLGSFVGAGMAAFGTFVLIRLAQDWDATGIPPDAK